MVSKIKPVYNTGDFGQDVFIPFNLPDDGTTAFTATAITLDAAATSIQQLPDNNGTVNTTPIDDNDRVFVANNQVGLVFPANNTAFTRTFTWTPDMNAVVYKVSLQLAVGINVSTYGAGNFNVGAVKVGAVERDTGRQLVQTLTFNQPVITTNLTAAGSQILIIMGDYDRTFKVFSKSPIDITVSLTTVNGTTTWQEGILPEFCFNKLNVMKSFAQSGIKFHVHASPDHADEAFKWDKDRIE